VKLLNANDSVGLPHVKVGSRQELNVKPRGAQALRGFFIASYSSAANKIHISLLTSLLNKVILIRPPINKRKSSFLY
jgi:hypothetical protein